MTLDDVKANLGALVAFGNGVYEIAGFSEQPVVILRLIVANPFSGPPPERKIVRLPKDVGLLA